MKEEESRERRDMETTPNLIQTMQSLREEFQSIREDNETRIRDQEEKKELNSMMLKNMPEIKNQNNQGQTSRNVGRGPRRQQNYNDKHIGSSSSTDNLSESSSTIPKNSTNRGP